MQAIISDIHGNLEAMTEVLVKIESLGIDQIVVLGDIVVLWVSHVTMTREHHS